MGSFVSAGAATPGTAATTSVATLPAGLVAGDRVHVVISNGGAVAGNTITDPTTAAWVKLDEWAPDTSLKSALYYIDVTAGNAAALSGSSHTWTWATSSRTTCEWQVYRGVDQTRPPVAGKVSATGNSSAATAVPTITVPAAGDWEAFVVAARESPGTDTAKSWSATGPSTDVERVDLYATNTGTGMKLSVAGYDTAGPASAASGGGGTVVALNDAPPVNTWNSLALTSPYRIGATIDASTIGNWEPRLLKNQWLRIFPNGTTKLPPDWTDSRFQYCQRTGAHPFLSAKTLADATKLQSLYDYFAAMPAWLRDDPNYLVWYCSFHEPEKDYLLAGTGAAGWISDYKAEWNKLATLPANIRSKIRMGPALTKQWTESAAKGNFNYQTYDPGPAFREFKGYDVYADSNSGSNAITAYPNPATFLQYIKADDAGGQPKIFVELGVIGAPFDTDGTARAVWLQGVYDEAKSWGNFGGFIWWNDDGTSGGSVAGIGTARYFELDRRHTGTDGSYVAIPAVASSVTVGGSGGGARTVTPNVLQANAHVWAYSVPMVVAATVDPATVNAWASMGLPIK